MEKKKIIIREEKPVLNVLQLISTILGAILLFVFGMLLLITLAGCSIIDEDTSDCPKDSVSAGSRSGSAIAFSVGDSTACTKGTVLSVSSTRTAEGTMTLDGSGAHEQSLKEKGFGVFACHTGVHPYVSTSTTSNLLYNQQVAWNDGLGTWSYSPIVYWPNGDDGADQLVTFFAYGPHSDNAGDCIVDMSRPDDTGDPWLTYKLGGTEDDWQTRQVDLLYDFRKDQKRDQNVATRVAFSFSHALACAGDEVTVTAGPRLQAMLLRAAAAQGRDVSLTLTSLSLDYLLTRKGRLVLNNSSQPNWQAVESEDPMVHRLVSLTPGHVLASSTSSACSVYDYTATGRGVFYIPIETAGGTGQQVEVTAGYSLSYGYDGEVTATVDLSRSSEPSENRNLRLTLEIPDPGCPGRTLPDSEVGMIICSHGKAHAATDGELACGGKKVAVVAYRGDGDSSDFTYNAGLAIALSDASTGAAWCSQTEGVCLGVQTTEVGDAIQFLNGLEATAELTVSSGHTHAAALAAAGYQYDGSVEAGGHPVGTSRWFLPSMGQWNLMVKAMNSAGDDTGLTTSNNANYQSAAFNDFFDAAGGSRLAAQHYWSSTEAGAGSVWYMTFERGQTNKESKAQTRYVRPILAF